MLYATNDVRNFHFSHACYVSRLSYLRSIDLLKNNLLGEEHIFKKLLFNIFKEDTAISSLSGKDKAAPLQSWRGPDCSSRLRLPDFKTIGT